MTKRARVVAAGALLAAAFVTSVAAHADDGLVLSPDHGMVGDGIQADEAVSKCAVFVVRWKGDVVATDDGRDGEGRVFFRVPDSPEGTRTVVAACQASPGGAERVVGRAEFTVLGDGPVTTTTAVGATTTVVPTTTTRQPAAATTTAVTSKGSAATPATTTSGPATTLVTTARAGTSTTTSLGPASSGAAPQDVADCEREARNADSRLVYQPNRRMMLGGVYDVVVQIALDASDVPGVMIPGPEPTTIVRLRSTRCTIEAQLTAASSDFQVTPPNAVAQSFISSRVLTWRWQVVPLRAGPGLKLLLHLQPTVIEDGKVPRPGSDEAHEALIEVDAASPSLIARVGDKANGLVANDLVKVLLIPSSGGLLSLWAAHRFRRRAKGGTEEP